MKSDVVYLKLEQDCQVVNRKILIRDVAEIIVSDNNLQKEIGNIVLYTVKGDKNQKLIFSAMKIIELIQKQHPGILIENIGEPEFIVEYKIPVQPKKIWECLKTIVLALIVFFGAAFTIMTFNTDVSVEDVFALFYRLVMGEEEQHGSIMEIAYSVGIAIGVLGFYNHFSANQNHDDPTPIHIEMRTYEEEMNKAIIGDASREGKMIKQ